VSTPRVGQRACESPGRRSIDPRRLLNSHIDPVSRLNRPAISSGIRTLCDVNARTIHRTPRASQNGPSHRVRPDCNGSSLGVLTSPDCHEPPAPVSPPVRWLYLYISARGRNFRMTADPRPGEVPDFRCNTCISGSPSAGARQVGSAPLMSAVLGGAIEAGHRSAYGTALR